MGSNAGKSGKHKVEKRYRCPVCREYKGSVEEVGKCIRRHRLTGDMLGDEATMILNGVRIKNRRIELARKYGLIPEKEE